MAIKYILYQKRSDVIHGDANRANESWHTEAARDSEEISKNVLFQYLYAIPQIHSSRMPNDRKKLESWLRGLDNLAKRYRQQFKLQQNREAHNG